MSATEAVRAADNFNHKIRAMVSDLIRNGMTGVELSARSAFHRMSGASYGAIFRMPVERFILRADKHAALNLNRHLLRGHWLLKIRSRLQKNEGYSLIQLVFTNATV